MARILHFADLHLDGSAPDKSVNGVDLSLRRATLQRIVDLTLSLDIDAVTVGGDLYDHEHATAEIGSFIAAQFERLGSIPVLVAPGNHDPHVAGSLYEQTAWPSNVDIFRDTRWRSVRLGSDLQVWGIGHDQPELQENMLSRLRVSPNGTNIALFHGWDVNAGPPRGLLHCPFTIEDVERSGVDFALVGHYHRMSLTSENQPRYGYPGVPMALDAPDQAGHILLLSIEGSSVSVEAVELTPAAGQRANGSVPVPEPRLQGSGGLAPAR